MIGVRFMGNDVMGRGAFPASFYFLYHFIWIVCMICSAVFSLRVALVIFQRRMRVDPRWRI